MHSSSELNNEHLKIKILVSNKNNTSAKYVPTNGSLQLDLLRIPWGTKHSVFFSALPNPWNI